jgi:predicted aspartyl protease
MGIFFQPLTLTGPTGVVETLDAMVDTGAMFTVIPAPILNRLGVQPFDTIPVRFASGQQERWPIGQLQARLDGRERPILCLFGSADAPALIGAHTLEAFLLTVDPVEQKLVPKEALLMSTVLRLVEHPQQEA